MKNVLLLIGALFLVTFTVQAQTVEFSDDFESGADNWTLEGAWAITDAQSNSPSNSLTDSPGGNYLADQNTSATLATPIDLTAALDATLNFSAIYDIENGNFDYAYVEASSDNGATWVNLATIFGQGNLDPWVDYSYSMGGLVGSAEVLVRFRLFSDGGAEFDGIYIDDVEVTSSDVDNGAPLVLHDAPSFYESSAGDVVMSASIVDISGVATNTLSYSVDGVVASSTIDGVNVGGDTYTYTIPAQDAGAQVDYSLTAIDASPAANTTVTSTFSYIAGEHIFYDNSAVNFVNVFGPAAASNLTGCAVRFATFGTDIAYALIRNYTDPNRPNNDFEMHIWADDNGTPGADLITPFMVTPEATVENNSPMTRVDLRAYAAELAGQSNVFVGFTVPEGEVWLTQTTPAVGNRTYNFDGTTWTANDDDYHFRVVTTSGIVAADDCADATDLSSLLGGGVANSLTSPIFDNTNATVGDNDAIPACWNDQTLENTQWFTFTGDGLPYNILTTDCGGTADPYNNDTQLVVYSGDDCGALTEVTCNEDVSGTDFASTVTVETVAGTTYYIMLDGWDGTVGQYCLEFSEVALVGCDEIALGDASSPNAYTCMGATTEFTFDLTSVVIPDEGPTRGFRWVVSSADITGSDNPFIDPSYAGAFGEAIDPYSPALLNDGSQLPAGLYFFTPVVYAGATGTAPAEYDFTDGCIITGTSVMMTLLDAVDALSATNMVTDETSDINNNGEIGVMAAGGSGDYTYAWDNGETTATISGLAAGDYTVTITDASGCVDPYTETITVDLMVGVGDVDFAQAIRLFPNPAKDVATIEYSFEESRQLTIQVTNTVGQVVSTQIAPQGQNARVVLDLTTYSNGVYFVEFNDGENQLTRRLVVNK